MLAVLVKKLLFSHLDVFYFCFEVYVMDEFSLIDQFKPKSYRQNKLIKGIGDDAAIIRMGEGDTVVAIDTFVQDVHFTEKTLTPYQIGYRILAVNLSDLAAMGATPHFYLVSIVIPNDLADETVLEIFAGMKLLADQYQIDLIGGDTVSGDKLTITITIIGSVPKGKARLRSDAQPGDVVFVTGTLGDASAGLDLLLGNVAFLEKGELINKLQLKHQQPTPRVEFAIALRKLKRVALNDISDGLANELHEIAESSQVTIEIDDESIPLSEGLKMFSKDKQDEYKYFGGEDFELVGTVGKDELLRLKEIAEKASVTITEIGTVAYNKERNEKVFVRKNGVLKPLRKKGYVHRSRETE